MGVSQNGQTPSIIGICSCCVPDRPVFERCQTLLHPELTPWWSFLLADGAHHKKPHNPTHPIEIWWMTLKNNRAPLQYHIKLCAAFQSHWYIHTGVTVQKRSIRVNIGDFVSRVTLKIDVWPWKTIGHLSYAASTFVHHFIANGEFKLKLQSGNAQFGSKSKIFFSCVTLKFDRWPWRTIGCLF